MGKGYTTISIKKSTAEMLNYLSKVTHRSKSDLMTTLISEFFGVGCNFDFLNIEFYDEQKDNALYILFTGKPRMHLETRRGVE